MKIQNSWMVIVLGFLHLIIITMQGCAVISTPTGGKQDQTPPRFRKTKPDSAALRFRGDKIVLYADSYVKPLTYGKEIFISPPLSTPPKISVFDRRVILHFQDSLRPQTTYVVTINDLTDHFSSAKSTEPFVYAFSTGDILDSMEIQGSVRSGVNDAAEKEFLVMLFDADSIRSPMDVFGKRPAYISKTNENGAYKMGYLRKNKYKIFAVKDTDLSNTYNLKTEIIAIDTLSDVVFSDTTNILTKNLYSFFSDDSPPKLKGYDWVADNALLVEVSETILTDSIVVTISDTLGNQKEVLKNPIIFKGEKKQLLLSPLARTRKDISLVSIQNLSDSLLHHVDTTFRVYSKPLAPLPEKPFLQKPSYHFEKTQFEWYLPSAFSVDSLQTFYGLRDSAKKEIPFTLSQEQGKTILKLAEGNAPKPPLSLSLSSRLTGLKDSTFRTVLPSLDPTKFGSVEGMVVTEDYQGKIILILSTGNAKEKTGKSYIFFDRKFALKNILPASYTATVIFDKDGNGVWTPGSLIENRLPEKRVVVKEPILIRANWELTKQIINVSLKGSKKKTEPKPQDKPNLK